MYQKPTDIWHNLDNWRPKLQCDLHGDDGSECCHASVWVAKKHSEQICGGGGAKSVEISAMPAALCDELAEAAFARHNASLLKLAAPLMA